ncbi:serine hydrolase domain-containing protein [Spirosoma pollinicola]|uniref:Serine hydrolase n=1 Tax=Spirosoma pollinicola TaxID=2057025 RepID=A0A2K8YSF6_9BACT|nr:serine hydrolase domain-containing protein [Spirosoma pollinicola]AUD00540.1 serine hydrolase [Spirosoma pollinicola]
MKFLYPAFLLFTSAALAQQTAPGRVATHIATYQPPVFSDANRLKTLEAAFPIVEKLYKDFSEKRHIPGLTFGIVVDGQLVYSGGTGYTDVAKKTAATPKSLFRIASMTKSLTAMAILKLRDEGKLRLDDPAESYIPELKSHKYLTADAPRITVRNLMAHSAGFPEDNPWGDRQLADSDADLLKLINSGISNANVPSFAYEYSNLGFAMLGHIITVVTGKPYQQYITDTILKPLGMNDTQWEYSRVPADKLALGYRWHDDGSGTAKWLDEPLLHDGSYGAMGGLITSIEDFSKYVALHQAAWPARNDADNGPVKRSSVREMQQPWTFSGLSVQARNAAGQLCPVTSGYGYGLSWNRNCVGQVWVGHSGGLPGFGSQWRILPDYGIGIISYGNLTYAGMGSVNSAVMDTLMAIGHLQPRQLPVSNILAQRKAEIVKLIPDWTNAEQSGIFAENFFPDKSVAIRKKTVQDLYAKVGDIKRVGELIPENQLRGHFLLEGDKGAIDVFFTLTPENPALIQQLDFREVSK